MRTTKQELYNLVDRINRVAKHKDYTLHYAYGQPRLERANQSITVSPRLPAREMKLWLEAYWQGLASLR
jgi:hypothetical protein